MNKNVEEIFNKNTKLINHLISKIPVIKNTDSITSLIGCFVGLSHEEYNVTGQKSTIEKISENIDFFLDNINHKGERVREGWYFKKKTNFF